MIEIVVQVNGKLRGASVAADADKDEIEELRWPTKMCSALSRATRSARSSWCPGAW